MIKSLIKPMAERVRSFLNEPLMAKEQAGRLPVHRAPDAASQLCLSMCYRSMQHAGVPLPGLANVGFKGYSQTDEDGILLYIFALIGAENKKCVEICAGDGIECNTANLIINHQWTGLLVDGDHERLERGVRFYRQHRATYVYPPKLVQAWITRDNVNGIIGEHGFSGDIDLLSLDVDGVDYWIWEAIDVITPRVVVLEYQDILGPERACTVPYDGKFSAADHPKTRGMPNFAGASLSAFARLAGRKGYRLVGCNTLGYNAFFVRRGVGEDILPEVSVHDCFGHSKVQWGMKERYPTVKDHPWVDV